MSSLWINLRSEQFKTGRNTHVSYIQDCHVTIQVREEWKLCQDSFLFIQMLPGGPGIYQNSSYPEFLQVKYRLQNLPHGLSWDSEPQCRVTADGKQYTYQGPKKLESPEKNLLGGVGWVIIIDFLAVFLYTMIIMYWDIGQLSDNIKVTSAFKYLGKSPFYNLASL